MIRDPYIGMPIHMGGRCDTMPSSTEPAVSTAPAGEPQQVTGIMPVTSDTVSENGANAQTFDDRYLGSLPLAMAYTPMQQWKNVYSPKDALSRGTVFAELDLPFEGRTILTERNNGRRMG